MNVADVLTKGTGMYYDEQSKMWNDMKKTGSVIKVKGYNKLFLTAASNLATTGDDELDDEFVGANKNRITAAFKRNQRGKTTSRFLTNQFIKDCIMQRIDTLNIDKFQDAIQHAKGMCKV